MAPLERVDLTQLVCAELHFRRHRVFGDALRVGGLRTTSAEVDCE